MDGTNGLAGSGCRPISVGVGVGDPEHAFEQKSGMDSVSHVLLVVDGDRDEEAFTLSAWAGASSEASASSGVPSAVMQHHKAPVLVPRDSSTPAANRSIASRPKFTP